jgi:hypothetical protein
MECTNIVDVRIMSLRQYEISKQGNTQICYLDEKWIKQNHRIMLAHE